MIFIHPTSHHRSIESISQMCFISVCVPMRVPVRVPVRVPSIRLALDQLFQP
jgi:hypothetical protein